MLQQTCNNKMLNYTLYSFNLTSLNNVFASDLQLTLRKGQITSDKYHIGVSFFLLLFL